MPPLFVDISTQAIVTAARVHFLGNLGPDPHGLNEHQALSIHMLKPPFSPQLFFLTIYFSATQNSPFYLILDQLLNHPDGANLNPYRPCASHFSSRTILQQLHTRTQLNTQSCTLMCSLSHSFMKLLYGALHKLPPASRTLFRASKQVHSFVKGQSVLWWSVASTFSRSSLLCPELLGETGPRCLFTIKTSSAVDVHRYSAHTSPSTSTSSSTSDFVLIPGTRFVVDDISEHDDGLTEVFLSEDHLSPSAASILALETMAATLKSHSAELKSTSAALLASLALPLDAASDVATSVNNSTESCFDIPAPLTDASCSTGDSYDSLVDDALSKSQPPPMSLPAINYHPAYISAHDTEKAAVISSSAAPISSLPSNTNFTVSSLETTAGGVHVLTVSLCEATDNSTPEPPLTQPPDPSSVLDDGEALTDDSLAPWPPISVHAQCNALLSSMLSEEDVSALASTKVTRLLVVAPGCSLPPKSVYEETGLTILELPADLSFGQYWDQVRSVEGGSGTDFEKLTQATKKLSTISSRALVTNYEEELQALTAQLGIGDEEAMLVVAVKALPSLPVLEPVDTVTRTAAIVAGTRIVSNVSSRVLHPPPPSPPPLPPCFKMFCAAIHSCPSSSNRATPTVHLGSTTASCA